MKKKIMLIALALVLFSASAWAGPGDFGLGIIIGEPTGLSAKIWLSPKSAVDGGLAWSLQGDGALHLHADYLLHDFKLIHVDQGRMALYYGIGGRFLFHNNDHWWDDHHHHNDKDVHVGLRIPVGLEYIFSGEKMDLFLELAPVLDLVPDTDLDLNGGIGIRYFF
jgi:hypothetical protein